MTTVDEQAGAPAPVAGEGEVVVTTDGGAPMVVGAALATLGEWAEAKLAEFEGDNARVMEDIVGRILAGATVEDVLSAGQGDTISGERVVGRPFLMHGFKIGRSGYEGDIPWYANISAEMLDTREKLVVNTGAPKVLAALKALEGIGEWPIAVQINSAETKAGFTVLGLGRPDTKAGQPAGRGPRAADTTVAAAVVTETLPF